eukprot:SAG25_NODE_4627_length_779_cov_0.802941_1_plen_103_part_01
MRARSQADRRHCRPAPRHPQRLHPLQTDFCSAGWDHGAAGEQATRIRELEQKLYLAPAAAAALEPEAEAGTGAPYLAINVGAVGEPAAAYGQLSAIGAASPRG